ncbi:MAG TPA: class I SAM-dependent methyltransferase [Legionella sp.]|nr:class I SAM-dependent methyltransferase [Legionella sp.]
MRVCQNCETAYLSLEPSCSSCNFFPELIEGFPAFAPECAFDSSGFKAHYFENLARLEAQNFWFRARNRLIIWALGKYHPNFHSFLEIGCGTGFVLSGIAQAFPKASLQGSEIFINGLSFAAQRLPSAHLMQMDARQIPFVNEFDSIGAFDVLEHIQEDEQVLSQIHKALRPKGVMLLTVPQHRWLWSSIDDYACHVRRYTANELHEKVKQSGFEILRSTSFVTTLLPAMFLSRFLQKSPSAQETPEAGLELSPGLNFIFEKIMNAEIMGIRKGINFPVGGSRLIVAQKRG